MEYCLNYAANLLGNGKVHRRTGHEAQRGGLNV
jgi:hypothetical protein